MPEYTDEMRVDPFDDWDMPTDGEWGDFTLVDDETANRMVRRARNLLAHITDEEAKADAEVERIRRITGDRTHGARRALKWITDTLAGYQREILARDDRAPRTLRLVAGATVKANPTGGHPVIQDKAAFRSWCVTNEHFDRGADVKVGWEDLHLAIEMLHRLDREEGGGDGYIAPYQAAIDRLEQASIEQMKLIRPSHAQKGGRVKWNGEHWVDVHSGEVVPGLGREVPGFNIIPTVDQ